MIETGLDPDLRFGRSPSRSVGRKSSASHPRRPIPDTLVSGQIHITASSMPCTILPGLPEHPDSIADRLRGRCSSESSQTQQRPVNVMSVPDRPCVRSPGSRNEEFSRMHRIREDHSELPVICGVSGLSIHRGFHAAAGYLPAGREELRAPQRLSLPSIPWLCS
jgi:hypothetical protein